MHTTIILGFVFGIFSAIFFALYMVPQKITRVDTTTYLWSMAFGMLITAVIAYILAGCPAGGQLYQKGIAVLCGVVWGLGTMSFAAGISRIGLALASPIKNTTGVLGTLVGLVLFQEWKTTDPWFCLSGSLLIVASAIVIGMTGHADTPRRSTFTGALFSLGAAACYASYLYPLKLAVKSMGYYAFTLWMALGILLIATVGMLLRSDSIQAIRRYPPRAILLSMLGGVSWTVALFCMSASMLKVDLSVAWSLAQLNTLPAVLLGIVCFHEVHFPSQWQKIMLGLAAAVAGTILLGFAK